MSNLKRKAPASSGTATIGQKRKKQKLEASRLIATQYAGSTAGPSRTTVNNGMNGLPGSIDVEKFAEARGFEMDAMRKAMKTARANATHRVWQTLPRHLRRRAASHDVRRVPKRLREKARAEMDPVKNPKSSKSKPQRGKANRLTRTETFMNRQREKTWLETHLWHAKRMKMEDMWGYRLAIQPTEKSFRPSYRASVFGCRLHDASYYGIVELKGPEHALKAVLAFCCHTQTVSPGAVRFRNGARVCKTDLYNCAVSPLELIGQATVMWQPVEQSRTEVHSAGRSRPPVKSGKSVQSEANPSVDVKHDAHRRIWIRCHPSWYDAAFSSLQTASSKVLAAASKDAPEQREVEIELADLRGQFNIFEFVGPKSSQVIHNALVPVKQDDRKEFIEFWNTMTNIQSTASVPEGMMVGTTVYDPRLNLKVKVANKHDGHVSQNLPMWPTPVLASSDLWDEKTRLRSSKPRFTKKAIDERKSKSLVPGSQLQPLRQDDRIALLLVQNSRHVHNLAGSKTESSFDTIAHGWTLMFPKGWGMPFFNAFVSAGTRVAGQREEEDNLVGEII